MAGRSPLGAVKEEIGSIAGRGLAMANFLSSLKSTVQNAEGVTREIEEKKKENQILREKLQIEVVEKFRLEKECKELKEKVEIEAIERLRFEKECMELKGVREERDRLKIRLKENEVDRIELKRINWEVEREKLRAETELDVYKTRFKELEGRVCRMEKDVEMLERLERLGKTDVEAVDMEIEKDGSAETTAGENFVKSEILSGTNANPGDSSSHKKTEDRFVIIVSDDEAYMSDE